MGAIAVTSPLKQASGIVLQSSQQPPHDGVAVAGTVRDSEGELAAFVPITFSGSAGVYFSTVAGTAASPFTPSADDDLAPSLVGATTAEGELPPVYVYFTRSGFNRVTISSGAVSRSVCVIAPGATDPYRVSVGSVAGNPGARLIVMGSVLDAFGNPVPNLTGGFQLTLADPEFGALNSATPGTDASGMFSTAFRSDDVSDGHTQLVITLTSNRVARTVNPAPDQAWLSQAGLRIPDGQFRGVATASVSGRVRFTASHSLLGGGKARLRGTAEPGSVVDIYAKPAGRKHSSRIGTVIANDDGNWGIGTTITTSTRFRARIGTAGQGRTMRTTILTTVVQSNQTARADALGGGRVRFTVHGVPHVRGDVTIYENGQQLANLTTDRRGIVSTVIRSSPGRHQFRVYFQAPGTEVKGRTLTGTVR